MNIQISPTTLKAAALENNCNAAGCNDIHAMGKAQEAKLVKKVEPPPVPNMEDEIPMRFWDFWLVKCRYHKKGLTGPSDDWNKKQQQSVEKNGFFCSKFKLCFWFVCLFVIEKHGKTSRAFSVRTMVTWLSLVSRRSRGRDAADLELQVMTFLGPRHVFV